MARAFDPFFASSVGGSRTGLGQDWRFLVS